MKTLAICYFLLLPVYLFSQTETSPLKGSASFLIHVGAPELAGLDIDYYLNNRLSLNAGVGYTANCHAGANVYLTKREHSFSTAYTGFQLTLYNDSYVIGGEGTKWRGIYIPVGYEYVGKKGFKFQLDLGPCFFEKKYFTGDTPRTYFFISVKVGKTIRKKDHTNQ